MHFRLYVHRASAVEGVPRGQAVQSVAVVAACVREVQHVVNVVKLEAPGQVAPY